MLAGKTAVVTGGSRGIGAAVVRAFLAEDMTVWTTGRNPRNLHSLETELASPQLHTAVCDSAVPGEINAFFEMVEKNCEKLDILVGNAAIGVFGPAEETSLTDWDRIMEVNARGTFLFAQRAFRWMKRSGGGRIIHISSVVGLKGYADQIAYSASKHAVMGITKVLAAEGQPHGIRASVICPGGVATDMVREARPDLDPNLLIRPEDVVRAVLYLAKEPETCCTDLIQLRRTGSTPFA